MTDQQIPDEDPPQDKVIYESECEGGPLDGQIVVSRCPRGFLAVDRPNNKVWIYDYTEGLESGPSRFVVRENDGEDLDVSKRLAAAEGHDYDVLAV